MDNEQDNEQFVYDLFFSSGPPPSLLLEINNELIEKIPDPDKLKEWPFVFSLSSQFEKDFQTLPGEDFAGDLRRNTFGFKEVMKKVASPDLSITKFAIELPAKSESKKKKCMSCEGTGKEKFPIDEKEDEKCRYCGGSGKQPIYDWERAIAIVASLQVFFVLASIFSEKIEKNSSTRKQLMSFVLRISRENMGLGTMLDAKMHSQFIEYLKAICQNQEHVAIEQATKSMQIVHKHIFGPQRDNYFINVYVDCPDFLVVNCDIQACGLYTAREYFERKLVSHNVDTPFQQIILLSALATICQMAKNTGF